MGGSGSSMIIWLVVMVAIFYFTLIRPESKRKKAAEEMRNSLKKGDVITTIGGIVGRVVFVQENTLVIETSEDRVRLEITKWAISNIGVQTGNEPAKKEKKGAEEAKPEVPAKDASNEIPAEVVDEIPASEENAE